MKTYFEKREVLCSLAEIYLDTKENSYISVSDGIMDSHDFDTISFLKLMALTYPKEEVKNIYSMDIEVSDEMRKFIVDKEYAKIMKLKKEKPILGKIILKDISNIYDNQFADLDNVDFDNLINSFLK